MLLFGIMENRHASESELLSRHVPFCDIFPPSHRPNPRHRWQLREDLGFDASTFLVLMQVLSGD